MTTIGLLAVISGFNSVSSVPTPTIVDPAPVLETVEAVEDESLTVKKVVMEYFSDLPIMIDIARCESHYRQTDENGKVLRGKKNSFDVGVMQINEKYHLEDSKKLGHDIHTLEGNMAYARYLYEKQGARPWLASSACWAQYSDIARR